MKAETYDPKTPHLNTSSIGDEAFNAGAPLGDSFVFIFEEVVGRRAQVYGEERLLPPQSTEHCHANTGNQPPGVEFHSVQEWILLCKRERRKW